MRDSVAVLLGLGVTLAVVEVDGDPETVEDDVEEIETDIEDVAVAVKVRLSELDTDAEVVRVWLLLPEGVTLAVTVPDAEAVNVGDALSVTDAVEVTL